jgi:hypothetical protein
MILYNPTISGSLLVTGSLTTTGTITSQTLVVQTITSSVSYLTGSTQHGSVIGNTHQFTGSVSVSGSVGIGTNAPSQLLEVVGGEIKAGRVDSTNEGGQVSFGRASDNSTSWYIDNYGNTSSTQLRFVDVTGGAVRMILTGSNVGIGVTPSAWTSFTALQLGGSTYSAIASNNHYLNISANTYYDGTNFRYITTNFSTRYQQSDGTHLWYIASSGTAGNTVSFTTAMSITSTGDVLIGNTDGTGKLVIAGDDNAIILRSRNTSAGGNYQFYINHSLGNVSMGNSRGTVAYNNSSDYRLKEDLKPFNGLDILSDINFYDFKWKESQIRNYGIIAHELQEVIPYIVEGNKDELFEDGSIKSQQVDITKLIPILGKAIQEQQAKITALEEILQRNNIQ